MRSQTTSHLAVVVSRYFPLTSLQLGTYCYPASGRPRTTGRPTGRIGDAHTMLAMLAVAAAMVQQPSSVPGYFEHPHSIGPKSEQYGGAVTFNCESGASGCPAEVAARCTASRRNESAGAFHCRSFSILAGGTHAQLYYTDYNASIWVARWTMWSLSDGPDRPQPPPGPPGPPGPPHHDESGRADYCAVKKLSAEFAGQLLTRTGAPAIAAKVQLVTDALQLETACAGGSADNLLISNPPAQSAPLPVPVAAEGGVLTVFVDPSRGSDTHDGAAEGQPMASIEAALVRLRERRRQAVRYAPSSASVTGAELVLREGTHFLSPATTGPLLLGPEDSHLTIRGYGNGERAILSGGVPLHLQWIKSPANLQVRSHACTCTLRARLSFELSQLGPN